MLSAVPRASTTTAVVATYILALTGVALGMNAGYTADSVDDAVTAIPAEDEVLEWDDTEEPPGYVQASVEQGVGFVLSVADITAVWTYQNRGWISPQWASWTLSAAMFAPVVWLTWSIKNSLPGIG